MTTFLSSRSAASVARPALILLAALALLCLGTPQANAKTYYVSVTGTGDGTSWSKAGPLQTVITEAKSGDQVWVKYASSSYAGNFTATDGVSVYGHFAGTETRLDQRQLTKPIYASTLNANGSGTVYSIPAAATGKNTLDGFTVQGGTNRGIYDPSGDKLIISNCTISGNSINNADGGGVYATGATLTVSNSTFTGNNANAANYSHDVHGGGVWIGGSTTAAFSNCFFTGNSANGAADDTGYGGAIFAANTTTVTINTCTITSNSASNQGGGVYANGNSISVTGSTFTSNTNGGVYAGTGSNTISGSTFTSNGNRGLAVFGPNSSTISDCTFTGNSVGNGNGGGLYAGSLTTMITGCDFTNNSANCYNYSNNVYGGGLYVERGTTTFISGCTVTGNTANGAADDTGLGGGLAGYGTPYITNCTFSNNSPDEINLEDVGIDSAPALIADSLIYGQGTGGGNGIDLAIDGSSTTFAYVIVSNNDIVNNNAALNIGTGSSTGGAVEVANNVFYNNNGGVNYNASVDFTSSHNDLYGNTYKYQGVALDSTDKTLNPKFISGTPGNANYLRPAPGSPLIDAGDKDYVVDDTDLAGNPRILGETVDIGAYEAPTNSKATVTALSPSTVQAGHAAFTLTVTGTGFVSGATISFGGISLPATFVSSTKLTVTVPAADVATAQTLNVAVVNSGMQASNGKPFTVAAAPTLVSLSPTSKPAGSAAFALTVNGTGFASGAVITFGGTNINATVVSSTKLTVTIPASLLTAQGSVAVTETNPQVAMTNALTFTLSTPIATLTSVSPSSVQAGGNGLTITLSGTYFLPGAVVKWNGTTLTSALFSSTAMAAQVPASLVASPGTASITVTNPGVAASNAVTFTITAPPAPAVLTSLSPSSAKKGSAQFTLTLTGTGFVSGAVVKWNGVALTSAYFSATTVVAQVPASDLAATGTASVTVVNPGVAASNAKTFTVTP